MLIDILETHQFSFENKKNIRIKNPIFLPSKSFLLRKNSTNELDFIKSNEEKKNLKL